MTLKLVKFIFTIYQGLTRTQNATCRFRPTCSQYALCAVEKYGLAKGTYLTAIRLLNCHPFSKRPIYDPA